MKKRRILIANEVKLTLELESSFLQREGFSVHSAGSGREALDLAREVKPDLIVLDYDMPLLPGVEVCSALRSVPALAEIPVLIVSDHDSPAIRERCQKAGCTAFCPRTAGTQGLMRTVAEALKVGLRGRSRVSVKLKVQAGAHYQNFRAEVRDLSEGGLQLETPEPIDVGLPVVVQFRLPGRKRAITATVCITRCSPGFNDRFLVAARFESLDADSRHAIQQFLESSQTPATIAIQRSR
ncbi:MAG: response regulator [Acidobacteriota bacterium]